MSKLKRGFNLYLLSALWFEKPNSELKSHFLMLPNDILKLPCLAVFGFASKIVNIIATNKIRATAKIVVLSFY
ncbi:MAG: hypothetical protein WCN86_01575 [bacterium]